MWFIQIIVFFIHYLLDLSLIIITFLKFGKTYLKIFYFKLSDNIFEYWKTTFFIEIGTSIYQFLYIHNIDRVVDQKYYQLIIIVSHLSFLSGKPIQDKQILRNMIWSLWKQKLNETFHSEWTSYIILLHAIFHRKLQQTFKWGFE